MAAAAKNMDAYLNTHYEGMTPEKLIHMLYKGALKHIDLARQGVVENNPQKRGEHLSKTISIISELNTSIDSEAKDESIQFLRGLYTRMLTELPKVSITNDTTTLDLTESYLKKLNEIWETQVLPNPVKKQTVPPKQTGPNPYGAGRSGQAKSFVV